MATNDDPSANNSSTVSNEGGSASQSGSQPSISADKITDNTGNIAVGSDINQHYAARDQFSGPVTINYYDKEGNLIADPGGDNGPSGGGGSSQPSAGPTPQLNISTLNDLLSPKLKEPELRLICQRISDNVSYWHLDYDNLQGNGPADRLLSLIQTAGRYSARAALIEAINYFRPDIFKSNYNAWHEWAAAKDAS